MYTHLRLAHASLVFFCGFACGCAGAMGPGDERIPPPRSASVSPQMDYGKITTVGVFPVFPAGVADPVLEDMVSSELSEAVQTHQSQWQTISHRELLSKISQSDLGAGYKNLQADMNASAVQGYIMLSPASRAFLQKLSTDTGAEAFLVGSYQVSQEMASDGGLTRMVDAINVKTTLLYVPTSSRWWIGDVLTYGDRSKAVRLAGQSLGANVGKGKLMPL